MINFPIKVLIGAGAAGAVGLGGYGIYSVAFKSSSKTIAQVLEGEGKVLLSFDGTEDDSTWNEKFTAFNSGDTSTHKLGSFKKESENKKAMREECKNLSSEVFDSSKSEIKEQVKRWCTKDKTPPQ